MARAYFNAGFCPTKTLEEDLRRAVAGGFHESRVCICPHSHRGYQKKQIYIYISRDGGLGRNWRCWRVFRTSTMDVQPRMKNLTDELGFDRPAATLQKTFPRHQYTIRRGWKSFRWALPNISLKHSDLVFKHVRGQAGEILASRAFFSRFFFFFNISLPLPAPCSQEGVVGWSIGSGSFQILVGWVPFSCVSAGV